MVFGSILILSGLFGVGCYLYSCLTTPDDSEYLWMSDMIPEENENSKYYNFESS